jgi:hypothetical protein
MPHLAKEVLPVLLVGKNKPSRNMKGTAFVKE